MNGYTPTTEYQKQKASAAGRDFDRRRFAYLVEIGEIDLDECIDNGVNDCHCRRCNPQTLTDVEELIF